MKALFVIILSVLTAHLFAQDINQLDAQGKRHGSWKKNFDGTQVLRYEGQFDHGKEIGLFKFYKNVEKKAVLSATKQFNEDGSAYVKFMASNGKTISEGKMMGKLYIGKWVYYHNNSNKVMTEEHYNLQGQLDGERKVYYLNGQLAESQYFKSGNQEGTSKMYSENGTLLNEYTYAKGQLHGPAKAYDPSGNLLSEGVYRHNKQHGIWKYYEKGTLKEEKDYTAYSKNPYKKQ